MTRLLLITDEALALTLSSALSTAADLQVYLRPRATEAKSLLAARAFDVCLFVPKHPDADFFNDVAATRAIVPQLPLAVVLPAGSAEAQKRLLTAGADLVLYQPIDSETLAGVVDRLASRGTTVPKVENPPMVTSGTLGTRAAALSSALEVLRDFSKVLGFSLDHRLLTQHFILKLREVIGLSRIAIFLDPGPGGSALNAGTSALPCAAAVGLPAELVECFALSRKSGLGYQLMQHPQILRAPMGSMPPMLDQKIVREFEVLGGQVAIPVNDRERTIGVAVLGGRITGGEFFDEELLLVFHLLEELGLAIKNSWLHTQLVASHRMFGHVLEGLTVGALVAGPGAKVMYANRAIARFLCGEDATSASWSDLPAPIAARLDETIDRGIAVEPFFQETGPKVFRVTLLPLGAASGQTQHTAMLLLEDFTQIKTAQRAEIESSNLKLISLIARRFAHEIRNSLVPLTTHQQLFDAEIDNADFRESLKAALARETRRIQRFTDQMLLLARSDQPPSELAPFDELLRASFEKSRVYAGGEGRIDIKSDLPSVMLRCNRASLIHAFQEIFLNGLQSSSDARHLTVSLNAAPTAEGRAELVIKVRDSGEGFAAESAPRATEPFFTTRNTGVGLGLTIARRVIEAHQGRLEVHTRITSSDPDLVIHLPLPN